MPRIISDSVHARLVAHLGKNEAVALFQELLLSPKTPNLEATTKSEKEVGDNTWTMEE